MDYFPKTLFTENSTTFDIISENYPFKTKFGRLALEMMIIHGPNVENGSIDILRYSDDEYTPSVFSTYTYKTSGNSKNPNEYQGGYVQWKPISYQDDGRKSTASQQVTVQPAKSSSLCMVNEIPVGLASALYGMNVTESIVSNVTHWFVVFGTSGDETFINSSHNTW